MGFLLLSCFYSLFCSFFGLLQFLLPFLLLSPPPSSFLLFLFLLPFLLFLSRLYPQRSSLLSLKWYHATGIISFHEAATALEGIEEEVSGTSISIGPT